MRYLLLALAACDSAGPDLITVIDEPRVLAVVSQPSTLLPDGDVELSVVTVDAAGPRTGDPMQLRACSPWRFVAEPSLDCVGADALALEPDADGRLVLSTAQLLEAFPPPDGTPLDAESLAAAIEAGLQPRIPVIAEVELDGETVIARRDLHIDNRDDLNNPVLVEVRFDGQATRNLRAGESHELTLEFSGFDRRQPDRPEYERFDCYFYSPHGSLEEHEIDIRDAEISPITPPNTFTAGEAGDSWLFVVATDRTGGMSADAIPLVIE